MPGEARKHCGDSSPILRPSFRNVAIFVTASPKIGSEGCAAKFIGIAIAFPDPPGARNTICRWPRRFKTQRHAARETWGVSSIGYRSPGQLAPEKCGRFAAPVPETWSVSPPDEAWPHKNPQGENSNAALRIADG